MLAILKESSILVWSWVLLWLWHLLGLSLIVPWLSDHTELAYQIKCLLNIKIQRFEWWINSYIILFETFTFCDLFKSLNWSADKLWNIINSCQNLCITISLYKFKEFRVNYLYTSNFIGILIKNLIFRKNLVLLSDIFLSKCLLQLIPSFLKFLNKLVESFINIPGLLVIKTLNFLFNMLNKLSIIIVYPFSINHKLI